MRISDWSSDVCSSDLDRPPRIGIERRLGTGFDLHRLGDIGVGRSDAGIDKQQRLPVMGIRLYMECIRLEPVTGASFCADCTKALGELAVEISLAGFPNGIESGTALLPAECGQFLDRCRQSQIVAKNGDVDVLGKALDQTEGFRSEEHTSELQSLMRISYAVFCLKKKNNQQK